MSLAALIAVLVALVTTSSGHPTISLLKPQGIRFSLPDITGETLAAFHYSINTPLAGTASGRYNVDVTTKTGNEWVHENTGVQVNPGDTVYYWYYYIKDGQGHAVTSQRWVAADQGTILQHVTTTAAESFLEMIQIPYTFS